MADGIPPAVDKVGSSAPGASESVSQAPPPAGLSGAAPAFQPTSAPTGPVIPGLTATAPPTVSAETQKPSFEEKKLEKDAGGAGPALSAPKPVEVHSVPDTPMGSTPAGGTPKPELPIPTEKIELPKSNGDASAAEKAPEVQEPPPTPAVPLPKDNSIPEPIKDAPASAAPNGKSAAEPAEMTGAIQTSDENSTAKPSTLKRKLEDDKPSEPVNGGPVSKPEPGRVEKKAKLGETAASAPSTETSTADKNGGSATSAPAQEDKETGKSNGRAKRGFGKRAKKIAEAVVGKTARKTRSQGPA